MKKTVALLLCLVIVFSFPASALATEIVSAQSASGVNEKTEVVSMRDTYSKTYLLPDGSYQYVAYAEPVHYKDSTNTFVEINNEIKESETRAGYKYTNTSNSWNAFFAEKLNSDDAVLITDGEYTVSFSFPGQTGLSTATKSSALSKLSSSTYYDKLASDDRTVVYQNVVANVDIVYTVQHSVLKEDIVLKSKDAPNSFKFRLNANGLTVAEKDGTIALFDAKGNEVFAFAPLYMEDSNGKRSENVQLTCTSVKNGYEITISADASFLNAEDTIYPVVIDPSVMVTGADVTFDTCVDQEYPTSNYYLSENLWTGGALGTNAMRTYMKYTLPTGISASQVTSAYVYLLKKEHQVPTIKAYRVTSDWSSSAITWNNKPSYTTTYASGVATNTTGNWYGLDVTTMVKNWLNGTYSNYGMVLKEPSEASSTQKTKFYSSDAPSPNKPELVINYSSSLPMTGGGISKYYGIGVNDYTNVFAYCSYGSRAGGTLVQNIADTFPSTVSKTVYRDANAYPSRFTGAARSDLFVYSGHGLIKGNYRVAHFFASSANDSSHFNSEHTSAIDPFEASNQNLVLSHKYVAMYTCNWLNWADNTQHDIVFATMGSGCRMQMGFGSRMYLDSREGTLFGERMVDYSDTIYNAFVTAANTYQKQGEDPKTLRIIYWIPALHDTFYSSVSGTAPGYQSNVSQYALYSLQIIPG